MPAQIDRAMLGKRPWKLPGRLIAWALIEGRPLTTRARWMNPLVFLGLRVAQYVAPPVENTRPLFIIGTGRSGTTVLGKLLGMHRQVMFLNEPKALWHFAHGAEDIAGNYTDGPARIRLHASDASPHIAQTVARVYGWARVWGRVRGRAGCVVDKYPEMVFRIGFLRALFARARCVAILRDGVDTCCSVTRWSARKGRQSGETSTDWWGRDGRKWRLIVDQLVVDDPDLAPLAPMLRDTQNHNDRAAVEWILAMRAAQQAHADHPDTVLIIHYEALCSAPDRTGARILHHCGLDHDPVFFDYARAVLRAPDNLKTLRLAPTLVPVFCRALGEMGYGASVPRVLARES